MDKISNLSEDAIKEVMNEMVLKYDGCSKEIARKILNSKISGNLSETVLELRSCR